MSKLSNALGAKYQEHRLSVMTRRFDLGDHTFEVRVPSVIEVEKIYDYFKNPDAELIAKTFAEITLELIEVKDTNPAGVVYSADDVVVEGRSMLETAKNKVILQYRVVEYFKFLIPEAGQSLDDLTYADIEDEFPLAIQIQFIDKISEVISPSYKDIKEK